MNKARNGFRQDKAVSIQIPSGKKTTLMNAREYVVSEINAGRSEAAKSCLKNILKVLPRDGWSLKLLGVIANNAGDFSLGLEYLQSAVKTNPLDGDLFNDLGNSQRGLGDFTGSLSSYQESLKINPSYAAMNNYALSLRALGRLSEAEEQLNQAIQIRPDSFELHVNLASLLEEMNKNRQAFEQYTIAIKLRESDNEILINWGTLFKNEAYSIRSYDDFQCRVVERCLDHPRLFVSDLARPTYHLLRLNETFSAIQKEVCSDCSEQELDYYRISKTLSTVSLLLKVMVRNPTIDSELERMFTRIRYSMLLSLPSISDIPDPFSISLALFCFSNDYVFSESDTEQVTVNRISQNIQKCIDEGSQVSPHELIVLASYRPLHQFEWSKSLLTLPIPEYLQDLLRQQVIEPAEEKEIISQIHQFGRIEDDVSRAVQEMYEATPYPRWVKPTFNKVYASLQDELIDNKIDVTIQTPVLTGMGTILVAGCGTGQHAIMVASKYPQSQIIAIDISLSSLAYATRKIKEIGLTNIRFMHGDLLQLSDLGIQFDLIECVGVLHHMSDPLAGWRVLVDILKPGGVMKIGLYSERARQTIVRIRELISVRKLSSSPENIRRLRQELLSMADAGDQDINQLIGIREFYNLNECVDLLFHVQEHRFSFIQIKSHIEELGLKFLGQIIPDQKIREGFLAEQGPDSDINNLIQWDDYEKSHPYTFIGMYVFYVSK